MATSEQTAKEQKKYTSGYYNGNRWPIQISIARFNVTLTLQPNEFILDTAGRKINDPFFDRFVLPNRLSRELSDTPVPQILVPPVTAATTAPVVNDGQAVRAVTEFTTDAKGIRRPVIPPPRMIQPQAANQPSYRGMTMDEARKAGFIRKVREVPEDYGVTDNSSATPPRLPPPMRYAMDTDQPAVPKAEEALPTKLQQALPKNEAGERSKMQQALKAAAVVNEKLDSETGFMAAIKDVPSGLGIKVGTPVNAALVSESTAPSASAGDEPLPAPDLSESEPLPAPPDEEEPVIPEPTVKPAQPPPRPKFICAECGQTFHKRPELVGHAKKEHPEKVAAIMMPYPSGS